MFIATLVTNRSIDLTYAAQQKADTSYKLMCSLSTP